MKVKVVSTILHVPLIILESSAGKVTAATFEI